MDKVGRWTKIYQNKNPEQGTKSFLVGSVLPTDAAEICVLFRDYIDPLNMKKTREYSVGAKFIGNTASGKGYAYWGVVIPEPKKPTKEPDPENPDEPTDKPQKVDPIIEYEKSSRGTTGKIVKDSPTTAQFTNASKPPFEQDGNPHMVCTDPGHNKVVLVGRDTEYRIYYDNTENKAKDMTITITLPDTVKFVSAIMGALQLDNDGGDKDMSIASEDNDKVKITYTVKDKKLTFAPAKVAGYAFSFFTLIVNIQAKALEGSSKVDLTAEVKLGEETKNAKVSNPAKGTSDLVLSKNILTEIDSRRNADFKFRLTLEDEDEDLKNREYQFHFENDTQESGSMKNGETEFTLSDAESVIIEGLPEGITYTVEEILPEEEEKEKEEEEEELLPYDAFSQRSFTADRTRREITFTDGYRDKGDLSNIVLLSMVPYEIWVR